MNLTDNALVYALIVGGEIAFWLVLLCGLVIRYVLRWDRVSSVVLWCVPLIDVALLAFTVLDLRGGTVATFAHGLATAYVAFTIAFGPMMIRWADQRFAFHVAGGPPPWKPPSHGWPSVLYELKLWGRCLLAVAIIYVLLHSLIAIVDQPSNTQGLEIWYRIPVGTAFFWFLFGPLWRVVFFGRRTTNVDRERSCRLNR